MIPSRTDPAVPGGIDHDKLAPTHDALSAWLLRALQARGFAESLLARVTTPDPLDAYCGVEMEVPVMSYGRLIGFADARISFLSGLNLWIEIKTDDLAIGALIRQIKTYRQARGVSGPWLAIMPEASAGAREFLAHAGVGLLVVPTVPRDLVSATAHREAQEANSSALDAIPLAR